MALTAAKGVKKSYKVLPLVAEKPQADKPDKASDGVRTLIARINSVDASNLANVTDDPVVVKQIAWLRANRPELADQVGEAIKAKTENDDPFGLPPIAGEGPDQSQQGEGNSGSNTDEATRDALLAAIANERTSDALASMWLREEARFESLPDDMQADVREAYAVRFDVLAKVAG
jgi:hypothetical protein